MGKSDFGRENFAPFFKCAILSSDGRDRERDECIMTIRAQLSEKTKPSDSKNLKSEQSAQRLF